MMYMHTDKRTTFYASGAFSAAVSAFPLA